MAHPQNSFRGLFQKKNLIVGGDGAIFTDYSSSSALLDANSTGLVVAGKVQLNSQKTLGANSTGFILETRTTLPNTRVVGGLVFVSNSTGKMLAYHSTGTTWKYANKTSVLA